MFVTEFPRKHADPTMLARGHQDMHMRFCLDPCHAARASKCVCSQALEAAEYVPCLCKSIEMRHHFPRLSRNCVGPCTDQLVAEQGGLEAPLCRLLFSPAIPNVHGRLFACRAALACFAMLSVITVPTSLWQPSTVLGLACCRCGFKMPLSLPGSICLS